MDLSYASGAFEQAKRFFALPVEKKMEIIIGTVPNSTVGYHAMESYIAGGTTRKHNGRFFMIPLWPSKITNI